MSAKHKRLAQSKALIIGHKPMRDKYLIPLILGLIPMAAAASESIKTVYPDPTAVIQAPSTFIIGASDPGQSLTCNGENVRLNDHGFFAHVVRLKPGDNQFTLRSGEQLNELHIKREILPPPIKLGELKLREFLPGEDIGAKSNDLLSLSVHGTPLSQVVVQIGNRQIPLRGSFSNASARHRRPLLRKRHIRARHQTNLEHSTTSQTSSTSSSDLYTGFYRVMPDDHWQGVIPKVTLIHSGKSIAFTPHIKIWSVSQPAMAHTTHAQTIVRLGPGLARTTPLDQGVRVEVDGWVGTQMRCRYSDSTHVWIDRKDLEFETTLPDSPSKSNESALAPHAVARAINISDDQYGQCVQIPLNQRLPYQVEQKISPNLLALKLYGVTADTDWINSNNESTVAGNGTPGSKDASIDQVNWKQVSDDIYEVIVRLHGNRQWGYKVYYQGATLCLSIKKKPSVSSDKGKLEGWKICLDPGHGGSEAGSIGCGGVHESEVNLAIAQKLQALLIAEGAKVIMTRTDDAQFHSLEERVNLADQQNCDILLSIHNNALPDGRDPWKEHGTSAFWYHPQSIELARCLKDSLVAALGFPDLGAKYQNLALARPTAMPAVLVEVGFMIHPDEYAQLINPSVQYKAAQALCDGLIKYVNGQEK